jgi:hypothetical protein
VDQPDFVSPLQRNPRILRVSYSDFLQRASRCSGERPIEPS